MSANAVRWTPFEQLHLTLEFLGNVPTNDINELQGALRKVASSHKSFDLAAESIGAFSSVRNPRVIWAGITGDHDALKVLQADIKVAIRPWVEEEETRPYRAHLTLGRVRPIKPRELRKLRRALEQTGPEKFGEWRVDEFALVQSKLSPHGAQHSVLATFPLQS